MDRVPGSGDEFVGVRLTFAPGGVGIELSGGVSPLEGWVLCREALDGLSRAMVGEVMKVRGPKVVLPGHGLPGGFH